MLAPASGVFATYCSRLAATWDCQCCSDMPHVAAALQHDSRPGQGRTLERQLAPVPQGGSGAGHGLRCCAVSGADVMREAVQQRRARRTEPANWGLRLTFIYACSRLLSTDRASQI